MENYKLHSFYYNLESSTVVFNISMLYIISEKNKSKLN